MGLSSRLLASFVLMALAATAPSVAQSTSRELRYPGDQFEEIGYRPRQSIGDAAYESVLMDLRDANFEPLLHYPPEDPMRQMARPVGLLKVLHRSNEFSTCTASVIERNLILTNWHCLPKYGAQVTAAALEMGYYSADNVQGVKRYVVALDPVETDQELDFAILRVNGDVSEWGRIVLSDAIPVANYSLRVVHHPAGRPKQITQKSCRASNPPVVRNRLLHKCDTLPGSSGAPVFLGYGGGARVVALHHAGVPQRLLGIDPSLESNRAIPVSQLIQNSKVLRRLVDESARASASPQAGAAPAQADRPPAGAGVSETRTVSDLMPKFGRTPENPDDTQSSAREEAWRKALNQTLGTTTWEIAFPAIGVAAHDDAVFVTQADGYFAARRSLARGAGLRLLGYADDGKSFEAEHADFGKGTISVGDVAIQR